METQTRILVCVTGMSPQVVTETVHALAKRTPPWVPHEVHLITTRKGAQNARLRLLSADPGWFERLRRDEKLPPILFGEEQIHVIRDAQDRELDDIRDDEDNDSAANTIADLIRRLTAEPHTELHASIAGGRKTMGYLLGAAMSLYGRPQDRLSHVLVSAQYEAHPEFFYPTASSRVITALGPTGDALDCRDARVWLGDIPFVRLRQLLPAQVLAQHLSYADLVALANRNLGAEDWTLDLESNRLRMGAAEVALSPREAGVLVLLAACTARGRGIRCPVSNAGTDGEWAHEAREAIVHSFGHGALSSAFDNWLQDGPDHKAGFEQALSRLRRTLKSALGCCMADPIDNAAPGRRGRQRAYALRLPSSQFHLTTHRNLP
ncbi:MAG: CRISPR-associated ring nuclease Csm6 [Tepidimonas sp.]|nr:CRISPR-associated ring nuclease Csm6 [Tepidimonas sp.]MDM7457535.1 CRISPR-associated ring nuclease Csm6 [Tepidimonas sp.]